MHPAASVILFTVSTGLGYGLLFFLMMETIVLQEHILPLRSISVLAFALILITVGLFSSMLHLGRPERAWRAMSQWRSSWLSREGVAAVLVYPPALLFLLAIYNNWTALYVPLACIIGALSLITVFCTSMIYASLKPIPAWHNHWTISGYLLYSIASGGVLYYWILNVFVSWQIELNYDVYIVYLAIIQLVLLFLFLSLINKLAYWWQVNRLHGAKAKTTQNTALGLSGNIKQLDPPHSSSNYLMKEMGFEIARNKANILKPLVILFTFIIPFFILILFPQFLLISLATLLCIIGITTERYLFFAQAKHVVTMYYK